MLAMILAVMVRDDSDDDYHGVNIALAVARHALSQTYQSEAAH